MAAALASAVFAGNGLAANLYVATTGSNAGNCQSAGSPCLTIAYALSQAAASGDTINVGSGTFTEELTISKSVVLNGAGVASTIIKAPTALTTNPVVPGGSPGQQTTIVFVTGATTVATIQNLQVQGPGSSACGSIGYGIFAGGGATLTLSNNHILMVRDTYPPLSGCQNGSAIRYGAPSTLQSASGSISGNVIDTYQKNGIIVSNASTVVTVSSNSVTGELPAPNIAQNGIQISSGAVATVSNNVVRNNQCGAASCGPGVNDVWATGILLFDAGAGTAVNNNTVSGNDGGLVAVATTAGQSFSVSGNTFSANRYANILASALTLNLAGNTISGSNWGVVAQASSPAATVVNMNGGNIVSQAATAGLTVFDDDLTDAFAATIQGSGNQFVNNAVGAANTPSQGIVSLACNWWGSPYGPINATNPLGKGNSATANTTFTNWAVDNTTFACTGNSANNILLASPQISVPTLQPALLAALSAMLFVLAGRRPRRPR